MAHLCLGESHPTAGSIRLVADKDLGNRCSNRYSQPLNLCANDFTQQLSKAVLSQSPTDAIYERLAIGKMNKPTVMRVLKLRETADSRDIWLQK